MLGTGLGHSVSSPKFGLSRVGTRLSSRVSSPPAGIYGVGLGLGVAVSPLDLGFHVVGLFCQLTSRTHKAGACFVAGTGFTHLFRHNQQE